MLKSEKFHFEGPWERLKRLSLQKTLHLNYIYNLQSFIDNFLHCFWCRNLQGIIQRIHNCKKLVFRKETTHISLIPNQKKLLSFLESDIPLFKLKVTLNDVKTLFQEKLTSANSLVLRHEPQMIRAILPGPVGQHEPGSG